MPLSIFYPVMVKYVDDIDPCVYFSLSYRKGSGQPEAKGH